MASTSVIAYGKFQPSGISGEVTNLGSCDLGSRDLKPFSAAACMLQDLALGTVPQAHLDLKFICHDYNISSTILHLTQTYIV